MFTYLLGYKTVSPTSPLSRYAEPLKQPFLRVSRRLFLKEIEVEDQLYELLEKRARERRLSVPEFAALLVLGPQEETLSRILKNL